LSGVRGAGEVALATSPHGHPWAWGMVGEFGEAAPGLKDGLVGKVAALAAAWKMVAT